jgi:Ni/Co efflux regulator RcnB
MGHAYDKESSMRSMKFIAAVAAASLACGSVAFAQDHDDPHRDSRPEMNRDHGHPQAPDGHGAGPAHSFYRGDHLPPQYRDHRYVVNDWRGHHLSAPPRGYHWVQTGDDFVLAAIATGVIASVFLANH